MIWSAVTVNLVRIPATVGRVSALVDLMLMERLSQLLGGSWLRTKVLGIRRLNILSAAEVRGTARSFAPHSASLPRLEALLYCRGLGSREESRYDPLPSRILLRVRVPWLFHPLVLRSFERNMHLIATVPGRPWEHRRLDVML